MRPYRQADIVDDLQVQYKSTGKAPAWAHHRSHAGVDLGET